MSRVLPIVLACLALIAWPTDRLAGQGTSSPGRSLAGTVRVGQGQVPDRRVRLSLHFASGVLADEVFSDIHGNFEFGRLGAGTYRLTAQLDGYESSSIDVEIVTFTLRTVIPPIVLHSLPAEPGDPGPARVVRAREFQIPKAARDAFEQGQRAAKEDRQSDARKHFARALQIHPEFYDAHYWLGVSLSLLGELPAARKSLERAIELKPEAPEAYLALAKVLNQMNEPRAAKELVLKGAELSPSTAAFWVELGRAEFSLGEFEKSIEHTRQAFELDSHAPPEGHLILANSCLKLKRYVEAEGALRAYLKADPQSPSAPKAKEVLEQLHRAGVRAPEN